MLNDEERQALFQNIDPTSVPTIATPEAVSARIRKLARNRKPGMDGITAEHFLSLFNGGRGRDQIKKQLIKEYSTFLQKFFTGDFSEHQLQLFHAIKLAAIPKSEDKARIIMLFSFHSKLAFSLFSSSKIKKKIVEESLPYQYGSKSAGAEAVIHLVQQSILQKPNYDVFSADAIQAYYNLNRDLFMKKLKELAPDILWCVIVLVGIGSIFAG